MSSGVDRILEITSRRSRLLRELRAGARHKPELVDSLECSRSTVDRALRQLVAAGMAEREEGMYRLTLKGRLTIDEYERFSTRIQRFEAASYVLDALPSDCEFDPVILESATIVEANRTTPHEPVERYMDSVRNADSIRALGSVVIPQYVETFRTRLVEDGVDGRLVLDAAAVDRLVSEHQSVLAEVLELDRVAIATVKSTPPFSVVLLETGSEVRLVVMVYVPEGVRGYIETRQPTAVEWGETLFERHWRSGTEIRPTEKLTDNS